jgi:fibronectin-binding autotransporter adhesin
VTGTSGVTGTCSGLTSNFAFVTPFFFYDANTVFLTLRTSFAGGGGTGNKIEVDGALDRCVNRRL